MPKFTVGGRTYAFGIEARIPLTPRREREIDEKELAAIAEALVSEDAAAVVTANPPPFPLVEITGNRAEVLVFKGQSIQIMPLEKAVRETDPGPVRVIQPAAPPPAPEPNLKPAEAVLQAAPLPPGVRLSQEPVIAKVPAAKGGFHYIATVFEDREVAPDDPSKLFVSTFEVHPGMAAEQLRQRLTDAAAIVLEKVKERDEPADAGTADPVVVKPPTEGEEGAPTEAGEGDPAAHTDEAPPEEPHQ